MILRRGSPLARAEVVLGPRLGGWHAAPAAPTAQREQRQSQRSRRRWASSSSALAASLADVEAAAARVAPYAHRTPVLTCSSLDALTPAGGSALHFKCELFQKTGAFKIRGATSRRRDCHFTGIPSPSILLTHRLKGERGAAQ